MNVRSVTWLAVMCALAGACVKVPAFQYEDAGGGSSGDASDGGDAGGMTGSGPSLTMSGGKYIVTYPGLYRMEFASGGFHFPDVLDVGGAQLIGATSNGSCNSEEGVGVSLYPLTTFSSEAATNAISPSSLISTVIQGPGLVKVALDWGQSLSNCAGSISGRTTFTFFPDGRISRMETEQTGVPFNTSCQCAGGANSWEMATYFAMAPLPGQSVVGVTAPTSNGMSATAPSTICFSGTNPSPYGIAFGWRNAMARVRKVGTTLVAINDMITPVTQTDLPVTTAEAAGTMWIDRSTDCAGLKTKVLPLTQDLQISVNDIMIGVAQDGMYGGETTQTNGMAGFGSGTRPFVVKGTGVAIGPFALWLELGGSQITSVDKPYVSYPVQGYPTQQVLWFADGLGPNETFTIHTN